MVNK